MSTTFKSQMSEIMRLAWQMVKRNGYTMSEALKVSWMHLKLKARMKKGIIRFFYYKESLMPETKGTGRKANDTLQTYYDTERMSFRSFKIANLVKFG